MAPSTTPPTSSCWPSTEEPYASVYGEAMAAGLPVVGWDAGNLPALVDDGSRAGLPVDDIAALADALRELADDELARKRLGARHRTGEPPPDLGRHCPPVLRRLPIRRPGARGALIALSDHVLFGLPTNLTSLPTIQQRAGVLQRNRLIRARVSAAVVVAACGDDDERPRPPPRRPRSPQPRRRDRADRSDGRFAAPPRPPPRPTDVCGDGHQRYQARTRRAAQPSGPRRGPPRPCRIADATAVGSSADQVTW